MALFLRAFIYSVKGVLCINVFNVTFVKVTLSILQLQEFRKIETYLFPKPCFYSL